MSGVTAGGAPAGESWASADTARLVRRLIDAGQTIATAESLTGGLVAAALTEPAGASAAVRGGVVAYHSDVKADLLGVDTDVLRDLGRGGAVQAPVARQLAQGARRVLNATWGIGTTGVAGPDPSDGQEVGTVFVAVAGPGVERVARLALTGDRATIRAACVNHSLALVEECHSAVVAHSTASLQ